MRQRNLVKETQNTQQQLKKTPTQLPKHSRERNNPVSNLSPLNATHQHITEPMHQVTFVIKASKKKKWSEEQIQD